MLNNLQNVLALLCHVRDIVPKEDEPGRIYELFENYVKPMFAKERKWFWWNIGFFGAACLVTKTHGFHQLDWMTEYLTKESPLDKAMQTQIPGQPMM